MMPMSDSVLLQILPFVVLFLVHHFVLAPWLRGKRGPYLCATLLLLGLFACWCFFLKERPGPRGMQQGHEPPQWAPEPSPEEAPGKGPRPIRPEWQELFMGILLIAGSQGLLAIRQVRRNEQKMQELKAESLSRQLESLRYQINPHFFMNTLNNIQSLILTDPDKAAEAVGEFSKLMRIVLYEGDEPTIPLSRELEYMRHYLSLMRLRYPEEIVIEAEFPEETGGALVPPLLMASFAENAFKHGISYTEESFVKLAVFLDGSRVTFQCTNTRHPGRDDTQHGLGMENIRKRLSLLYGSDYQLRIDEQAGLYGVMLDIPQKPVLSVESV